MKLCALVLGVVLLLGQAACIADGTPSGGPSPSTSSPAGSPTATPAPTPTASPTFVDELVLSPPSVIGAGWSLVMALPYGDSPDRLGTSPGGDGEGVMWGPEYGTQLPDGTWWFLDAAHLRLAQFSDAGSYLSEVLLPKKFLANGQYFQWADPFALADGSLVLVGTSLTGPSLLRMSPERSFTRVPLTQWVSLLTTDGHGLYGFDPDQRPVRVDPRTGAVKHVSAFTGQSGDSFALAAGDDQLTVSRGPSSRTLPVRAFDQPDVEVHPWVQAAMGADGSLGVFIAGLVERVPGQAKTVAGFFTVDRQGRVSSADSVPDPSSASDPGGGSHVGVRYGDSRPWLMFVDADAVRVYRKG